MAGEKYLMKERLLMIEAVILKSKGNRLKDYLQTAIDHFRCCDDSPALDALLSSIEEIEDIIDYYRLAEGAPEDIADFIPVLRRLKALLEGKDVVGLTDALEFKLLPLIDAWTARWV